MILTLAMYAYFALVSFTCIFTGWGIVALTIEMFRRRNGEGITYYDGGVKYEMNQWFDSIPAEDFYGHYK